MIVHNFLCVIRITKIHVAYGYIQIFSYIQLMYIAYDLKNL